MELRRESPLPLEPEEPPETNPPLEPPELKPPELKPPPELPEMKFPESPEKELPESKLPSKLSALPTMPPSVNRFLLCEFPRGMIEFIEQQSTTEETVLMQFIR